MLVALIFSILLSLGLAIAVVGFGWFHWQIVKEQNKVLIDVVAQYGAIVKEYTTPPVYEEVERLPMNMAAVGLTEYASNGSVARPEQVGDEDPLERLEALWDEGRIGVTPHGMQVLEEIDEIERNLDWQADG